MPRKPLELRRIDTRQQDIQRELDGLRQALSPRGEVVSEASRQRTLAVFGAPLSPTEVVRRICREVQQEGVQAVLRYSEQLDGAQLSAEALRVPGRSSRRPTSRWIVSSCRPCGASGQTSCSSRRPFCTRTFR